MKQSILLLSTVLIISTLSAQTTIAVVDFEANGINAIENKALSNRLRNELVKLETYQVIERELMDEILQEQGFQQSGCVSDECLVSVGKMVGVTQIVGGSISIVGNIITASVRMIDVETGELLKVTDYDSNSGIESILTRGMKAVATDLSMTKNVEFYDSAINATVKTSKNITSGMSNGITNIFSSGVRGAKAYILAHDLKKAYWRVGIAGIPYESYGSGEISFIVPAILNEKRNIIASNGVSMAYYRSNNYFYYDVYESSGLALNGETALTIYPVQAYMKYGIYYYEANWSWRDKERRNCPLFAFGLQINAPWISNHFYFGLESSYITNFGKDGIKPTLLLNYKI
ncbi:MAG: hypothetical protein HQ509_03875 [Candidatus Marinimicrobia bacterium]|nr:hypothetical protein [Candidatus Neomarinimicrobiota bacterium]